MSRIISNRLRIAAMLMAAWLAPIPSQSGVFDWFMGSIDDSEVDEVDSGDANYLETPHNKCLRDLGDMLKAYEVSVTKIMCKPLPNQTGEGDLPADVSKMAATAIQCVGWPVVYIEYDPNYVRLEQFVQGKVSRWLPDAVLDGGITGYDKDLIEKQTSVVCTEMSDKLNGISSDGVE